MRKGQSLIEVLIATAIGAIMVVGVIAAISPALRENKDTEKAQMGASVGKELLDNVRVMSESDWHKIDSLATTSATKYFLNTGKSPFISVTGTEGILTGPKEGMLAYWKMDEGNGSYVSDFGSSTQFRGTLYNDATWDSGKIGGGISFGGLTGQIVAANSSGLKYQGGDMSISLWVNPDATDDGGYLVSKPWNGSGQYNYRISLSGGANPLVTAIVAGATSFSTSSVRTISAGSWHNIAVTFDASKNVLIYIDGYLDKQAVHTVSSWVPGSGDANINLAMGCIYPYGTNNCAGATTFDYKGLMDDVRIYNRTLSATEIKDIYNSYLFTRYFYVDDVYRDGGGNIAASGVFDPSTKKITVDYSWSGSTTSSIFRYITRSRNFSASQTDWSGGPGQNTATSSLGGRFSSSTGITTTSTPGAIQISF